MKKILIFTLLLGGLVVGFYIYFHAYARVTTTTNETFITSTEIPGPFDGSRIVQISDVLVRQESCLAVLENVVASVNNLEPEIIFFTGNLFLPTGLQYQHEVAEILGNLNADLIKIAVLGYDDLAHENRTIETLTNAGFRVLNNESQQVFNQSPLGINIIGAHPLNDRATTELLLAGQTLNDRANILLASVPTFATTALDFPVVAQFSGHCLATQDISDRGAACFQFYHGTYRFADQLTVHVSSGVARFQTRQNLLRRPTIDSFLLISQHESEE